LLTELDASSVLDLIRRPPHHPGMNRRRFLVTSLAGALAAPLGATAQRADRMYSIGWLGTAPMEELAITRPGLVVHWEAFIEGLRELGWIEHQNIRFEHRYSGAEIDRYPQLAAELVALKPHVLGTGQGEPGIRALQAATTTIPIVMVVSADPVGTGLVASLARPGGNITGMSILAPDTGGKRLGLLREAVPKISRVAVLWNAAYPGKTVEFEETRRAARTLSITLHSAVVRSGGDFDMAFAAIARAKPQALVALSEPLTLTHQHRIIEFAMKRRLPLISEIAEFAKSGGLMTYGASLTALFHRAAFYVDRILKGAHPATLPIEQPTKFELVINLKTAKTLGLTIPPSLLARADQTIE
jgi:putative ABC transport system substrate-binding protein